MAASRVTLALMLAAAATASSAGASPGTVVSPLSEGADDRLADAVGGESPQRFMAPGLAGIPAGGFALDPIVPQGSFFNSPEYEALLEAVVEKLPVDEETYDYIVVGGGAAGCNVADVLSKAGKKVLLLERGMERTPQTTPNAMSARGAGIGLADATISQALGTVQGVRTFSGALMGGGSAVNLGIVIGEKEEFFHEMARQFPGYYLDYPRLKRAYDYVAWKLARAMPALPPFGPAFKDALTAQGFKYYGGNNYPDPSLFVQMGYQWVGYTLFDPENGFQRNSSDAILEPRPNLTVKTRHFVKKITFADAPSGKTANCVVYRPTKYEDIRPIGDLWSLLPSSAADWSPWVGSFMDPSSVLVVAGVHNPKKKLRRACLTNPGKGRIILSGGAVHTPLLLYNSGIGPAVQLGLIKVPQILDNPAVGSSFGDRIYLTIPGFLKHYVDAVPLLNPKKSLRRLQATEPSKGQNVVKLRLKQKPAFEPILTRAELEKAITPEIKEAITKIMEQSLPIEIITIDEDAESPVSSRFEPPVLLPDLFLFPGKLKYLAPALQPRVCQFMGVKYMGPHCQGQGINQRNLGCSAVTIEELSGDRLAEGFIYATRYMFPTMFRKDPILDAVTELLQSCANYRPPFGIILLKPLCILTQPIIKCLRKAVAPFYFTSEPKSRGSIRLKPSGEVVIDPQYLVHEQDLFDAIRGTASLVEQLNGDSYKGILQVKGPKSCPVAILNSLLDILLTLASTSSPFLTNSKNFALIQRYLQDLIPAESRRLRRLMVVDQAHLMKPAVYEDAGGTQYEDYSMFMHHDVDEAKIEKLGIKRRLEAVGFDFNAYRSHIERTDEAHLRFAGRRLDFRAEEHAAPHEAAEQKQALDSTGEEGAALESGNDPALKEAIEDCRKPCTPASIEGHTCARMDVCCSLYNNSRCIKPSGLPSFAEQQAGEAFSNADAADDEEAVKTEEFLSPLFGFNPAVSPRLYNKQWAATYPPKLPSPDNPKALAKFALSYMTSIGHLYGSAPMGKVVDSKFQVLGVNGLSIVDASVLPHLPRMNPVYTIMALGRYAGEIMLQG